MAIENATPAPKCPYCGIPVGMFGACMVCASCAVTFRPSATVPRTLHIYPPIKENLGYSTSIAREILGGSIDITSQVKAIVRRQVGDALIALMLNSPTGREFKVRLSLSCSEANLTNSQVVALAVSVEADSLRSAVVCKKGNEIIEDFLKSPLEPSQPDVVFQPPAKPTRPKVKVVKS